MDKRQKMSPEREHMSSAEKQLRQRLSKEGLLTYESFLDFALYDHNFGYYRTGKKDRHDYLTSPELHPLFGRTLARYIEELYDQFNLGPPAILELGGASGRLAEDILSGFTRITPRLYTIVEKGEARRKGIIQWVNNLDHLEIPAGFTFVIANEFFDAIPFHRIINRGGVFNEIYVGCDNGFFEHTGPLSEESSSFLRSYPIALRDGQTLEVSPRTRPIISRISTSIDHGCFLVFDYGYHQHDIGTGRFMTGSILSYHQFKISPDVFLKVGETDITHHVNFDHLAAILNEHEWRKEGEMEQYRFLYNAGIIDEINKLPEEQRLSAKPLLTPQGIGSMISVLGFSKGLPLPMPGFAGRASSQLSW